MVYVGWFYKKEAVCIMTQFDNENKSRDIQSNLAQKVNLVTEATGEDVNIAELVEKKNVGARPFTCFLDLSEK